MSHTCHANYCNAGCPPKHLMCAYHWRLVPPDVQEKVYANYRTGQCDDGRPSPAWFDAAYLAIATVAQAEGKPMSRRQRSQLDKYTTTTPERRES